MMTFFYTRVHTPTGTITRGKAEAISELEFLRAMNKWNYSNVGTWHYFGDFIPGNTSPVYGGDRDKPSGPMRLT